MSDGSDMKRFKDFENNDLETLLEGKRGYSTMVKATVVLLVMRIRALEKRIQQEEDGRNRDIIIGQLTAYSSYLSALAITFDTDDKRTASRIASYAKRL